MIPELVRRPAEPADLPAMSVVLGRAFHGDPLWRAAIPDPWRRARTLPRLLATMATEVFAEMGPTDVVEVESHVVGVAAWHRPGAPAPGPLRFARALPTVLRAVGRRAGRFRAVGDALERSRPAERHRYLFLLATDPGWWGQGVGSALLGPRLAEADAAGELVVLETRPENVAYYRRFGFEVRGPVEVPGVAMLSLARSPSR